jgi:hypothetical protein
VDDKLTIGKRDPLGSDVKADSNNDTPKATFPSCSIEAKNAKPNSQNSARFFCGCMRIQPP